jgi:hypothetical protein
MALNTSISCEVVDELAKLGSNQGVVPPGVFM